jgi:hypothetical protein
VFPDASVRSARAQAMGNLPSGHVARAQSSNILMGWRRQRRFGRRGLAISREHPG